MIFYDDIGRFWQVPWGEMGHQRVVNPCEEGAGKPSEEVANIGADAGAEH